MGSSAWSPALATPNSFLLGLWNSSLDLRVGIRDISRELSFGLGVRPLLRHASANSLVGISCVTKDIQIYETPYLCCCHFQKGSPRLPDPWTLDIPITTLGLIKSRLAHSLLSIVKNPHLGFYFLLPSG